MRSALIGVVLGAAALFGAGPAKAFVTVFGDSFAAICSRLAKAGRMDPEALQVCTVALGESALTNHDLSASYVNRATMYLHRQDWTQAIKDLDDAIKIDASVGEAWVNRGAAFVALGRAKDAIEQIDAGLKLGSEEPAKAYYDRALAWELLDDVKAAYFDYLKAVELDPKWPDPKVALTRFTVTPVRR